MGKIEEARDILKMLGLPAEQQNEMSALTLLALCGLKEKDSWKKAKRQSLTVTKGIMQFVAGHYGRNYAPNTRETFRRQVLHQFVQAGIAEYNPDEPSLPTNSPRSHYAIVEPALTAIRSYGTSKWKHESTKLVSEQGSLVAMYSKNRSKKMVPVILADGTVLKLSPGKHNDVQAAVIEQFAPRFAPGSVVLYMGDTSRKNLILDKQNLGNLGIKLVHGGYVKKCIGIDMSDKMIDVAKRKQINYEITEDKLKYITGKSDQIDFASSYFDFVFCLNSFHHYVSQDGTLQENYRILKPDGILVLLDPFLDNSLRRLWIIFLNQFFHEPYAKYHTRESLQLILNKNGFQVIKQKTFLYFTLISIIRKARNHSHSLTSNPLNS